jgi:hypothetical protein
MRFATNGILSHGPHESGNEWQNIVHAAIGGMKWCMSHSTHMRFAKNLQLAHYALPTKRVISLCARFVHTLS